jgi:hypothetical protein
LGTQLVLLALPLQHPAASAFAEEQAPASSERLARRWRVLQRLQISAAHVERATGMAHRW